MAKLGHSCDRKILLHTRKLNFRVVSLLRHTVLRSLDMLTIWLPVFTFVMKRHTIGVTFTKHFGVVLRSC